MFEKTYVSLGLLALMGTAFAGEHPIGEPVEKHGMRIAAVYLQAVKMTPALPGMEGKKDIHLEADIHAIRGNPNGFGAGEWIPYLQVDYSIEKQGSDWSTFGHFSPMVASDGPHYGANIQLNGPGRYRIRYRLFPPSYSGFYRHRDRETGVGKWWQPFEIQWQFTYAGAGKKGGY